MKLSFYPKPGALVYWPGHKPAGVHPPYVGRRTVADGTSIAHPAQETPVVVDSEHADADQRRAAERFTRFVARDGSLWPADEATARACGVAFVPVELRDGEWQPKAASAPSARKAEV